MCSDCLHSTSIFVPTCEDPRVCKVCVHLCEGHKKVNVQQINSAENKEVFSYGGK